MPENRPPAGYYAADRSDLIAQLARPLGRVLDVGCGAGAAAGPLRAAGATELIGVEIVPEVAAEAVATYDDVFTGAIEDALPTLTGPYDTILCLDVLEHLVDPGVVLDGLAERAAPGARLQVSVPNARHVQLVYDLMVNGTFGYADWGHRDRTHLRWFTRADIVDLVAAHGWTVTGTGHPPLGRTAGLNRATRGRASEFFANQWYVSAVRA